jgi:phosphate/sulfate permease
MSVTRAAALLAQAFPITLLRHRLGRRWLRHPVSIMTLQVGAAVGLTLVAVVAINEQGLPSVVGVLRFAAVLAIIAKRIDIVLVRRSARRPRPLEPRGQLILPHPGMSSGRTPEVLQLV